MSAIVKDVVYFPPVTNRILNIFTQPSHPPLDYIRFNVNCVLCDAMCVTTMERSHHGGCALRPYPLSHR